MSNDKRRKEEKPDPAFTALMIGLSLAIRNLGPHLSQAFLSQFETTCTSATVREQTNLSDSEVTRIEWLLNI